MKMLKDRQLKFRSNYFEKFYFEFKKRKEMDKYLNKVWFIHLLFLILVGIF